MQIHYEPYTGYLQVPRLYSSVNANLKTGCKSDYKKAYFYNSEKKKRTSQSKQSQKTFK